jgi:hypothetical protein
MANHLSFDVLISLVERRATAVDHARAQRHLASCGRCRSELEWLQRIRSVPGRDIGPGESHPEGRGSGSGTETPPYIRPKPHPFLRVPG